MTNEDLAERVRLHALWFRNDPAGRRLELQGVRVSGAMLCNARITRARLIQVDLSGADFRGVWFTDSDLEDVSFQAATLEEAEFAECRIRRVNFNGVTMDGGSLAGGQVVDSSFLGASLRRTNVAKSTFERVNMAGANLAHSHLVRWEVSDADLRRCDFQGATLSAATLRDSDLRDVNLAETDLSRTLLQRVKVANAHGTPFLAELFGESLDFSEHADLTQVGTLERLRKQLGGGEGPGSSRYGLGAFPALYRAYETTESEKRGFVVARRPDAQDVFRVHQLTVEGDTLIVDYEQLDPRFPGWLAADLIFDVLLLEFLRDEYRGAVFAVEYRNQTTGAAHIAEYGQHQPPVMPRSVK